MINFSSAKKCQHTFDVVLLVQVHAAFHPGVRLQQYIGHCRPTASSTSHKRRWPNATSRACASTAWRSSPKITPRCARARAFTSSPSAPDASSDGDPEEEPPVSVHAITSIPDNTTFQLATMVRDGELPALVDSGNTHCFISKTATHRLGLAITSRPGLSVGVANGNRVSSLGVCTSAPRRSSSTSSSCH